MKFSRELVVTAKGHQDLYNRDYLLRTDLNNPLTVCPLPLKSFLFRRYGWPSSLFRINPTWVVLYKGFSTYLQGPGVIKGNFLLTALIHCLATSS